MSGFSPDVTTMDVTSAGKWNSTKRDFSVLSGGGKTYIDITVHEGFRVEKACAATDTSGGRENTRAITGASRTLDTMLSPTVIVVGRNLVKAELL